ncbi:MAG: VanZ family protein [Verrucomicrobiales bacterium]
MALVVLWNWRFEMASEGCWTVADLRIEPEQMEDVSVFKGENRVQVERRSGMGPVSARFLVPGAPEMSWLHLRFKMKARSVVRGDHEWESARFVIEWCQPDGRVVEQIPVSGLLEDWETGEEEQVVSVPSGMAVPVVRLEQLGKSGSFELLELEMRQVEERLVWKVGKWLLGAGFFAWMTLMAKWMGTASWIRAMAGGSLWMLMAIQFVIPGPWGTERPLVSEFRLDGSGGAEVVAGEVVDIPPLAGSVAPIGEIPDQGSPVLKLKKVLRKVKQVLHVMLLLGFTVAMVVLVGEWAAVISAVLLAVGIELAQLVFGFGFDLLDVWDLAGDAIGVVLAVWVVRMARAWLRRRATLA